MPHINDLISDIYSLLQGKRLADPEILQRFGREFGDILSAKFSSQEERKPTIRMSNVGRKNRQLWYELNGYKGEEISGKVSFKYAYGSLLESLVISLAEAAGHEVQGLQEEISIDGITGHLDCIIDGILIDVKSCSPFSFKKFENGSLLEPGNDPFGYIHQLVGYAQAKKLPAAWLAIDKVSGDLCLLKLPESLLDEYNISSRIAEVKELIISPDPPDRCYEPEPDGKSGNLKLPMPCSYCQWKFECHKDANDGSGLRVFIYSDKPRFLVKTVKTPNVFEMNKESN